jgi:hypothetical protein
MWKARATAEFNTSPRTWWVTLTWRGDVPASYGDVAKFLRKLRKIDPQLRYLVTEEVGELGQRRHWHALVHCSESLSKAQLEAAWPHGFLKPRLATSARLARYMAKYQGKAGGVLRASTRYGLWPVMLDARAEPLPLPRYGARIRLKADRAELSPEAWQRFRALVSGVYRLLPQHPTPESTPRPLDAQERARFAAEWAESETCK